MAALICITKMAVKVNFVAKMNLKFPETHKISHLFPDFGEILRVFPTGKTCQKIHRDSEKCGSGVTPKFTTDFQFTTVTKVSELVVVAKYINVKISNSTECMKIFGGLNIKSIIKKL